MDERRREELRKEREQAEEYLDKVPGEQAPPYPVQAQPQPWSEPSPQPTEATAAPPTSPPYEAVQAVQYGLASRAAEGEIRRHLPLNPRNAKRVLNHLRLALFIAEQRGVFHDFAVSRSHLAKWVVLTEQWPRLGAALATDPGAVERLERAENVSQLRHALDKVCPSVQATPELVELLREQVPLAGVLDRIVRFAGPRAL